MRSSRQSLFLDRREVGLLDIRQLDVQAPAVCHDRRRDFRQRGDSALSALESRGWFSSTLRVRTYQFAHRGSELYLARASFANKARSLARSRRSPRGLEAAMRLRGGVRAALSAPSFEVEQARTNSQAPAVCKLQPELVRATSCRALGSATRARPARFVTERRAERSAMSLVRDLLRDGEEAGLQERGLQGTGGVERKQMHAKRLREDLLRVESNTQSRHPAAAYPAGSGCVGGANNAGGERSSGSTSRSSRIDCTGGLHRRLQAVRAPA